MAPGEWSREAVTAGVDARGWAEELARTAYGRLLAILAARDNDIALAEDCLGDAFARALATWPHAGVPDNPEGWLVAVARNRQRDRHRSSAHRLERGLDAPGSDRQLVLLEELDPDSIPDRRLALLFVCAHPAIDPAVRTALMLQAVLGFEARQIAGAFAMPASAMAQRLVRAKRRIREARIPFVIPEQSQMQARLVPVLEAIYGAYAIDFPLVAGTEPRESLAQESLYLAETLAELLPDEPEVLGLAALLSLSLARAPARSAGNEFVPLSEQDVTLWDAGLISKGETYLRQAGARGPIGRFQLEAALQSVHCARATSGVTDWRALKQLHAALLELAPTLGARVAYAAAVGQADGPEAGLAALEAIDDSAIARFQPALATRAHLLDAAGKHAAAREAFERAMALTTTPAERRYLERRAAAASAPMAGP